MSESLHEFVIRRLNETRGTWPQVSKESGVPLSTISRIAASADENPRIKTLEALAAHFREPPRGKKGNCSERRAATA